MTDYSIDQLKRALYKAHKEGNTDHAQMIAERIKSMPEQGGEGIVKRGSVLPIARTGAGDLTFAAPQFAIDAYEAVKAAGTPGASPEQIFSGAAASLPVGRGIAPMMTKAPGRTITAKQIKDAPTVSSLKRQASGLYDEAAATGDVIGRNVFSRKVSQIQNAMNKAGFDPDLHPNSAATLRVISKRLGDDVDMAELKKIRQLAKDAKFEGDKRSDQRMAKIMFDEVENMINKLPSQGGQKLREADAKYAQAMKRDAMNDVIARAKLAASGFENGLRGEFRSLLKSKKRSQYFTPEEKEMMAHVVEGGSLTNIMKKASKMGFGSGGSSNWLGGVIGSGLGAKAGSELGGLPTAVVGGVSVPVLGKVAGNIAERGTLNAAERAKALMSGVRPEGAAKFSTPGMDMFGRAILGQSLNQPLQKTYQHPTAGLLKLPLI